MTFGQVWASNGYQRVKLRQKNPLQSKRQQQQFITRQKDYNEYKQSEKKRGSNSPHPLNEAGSKVEKKEKSKENGLNF